MIDNHALMDQAEKGLERLEQEDSFYFYGVAHTSFKIDDMVLEVISDPDDGYRSYLRTVLPGLPESPVLQGGVIHQLQI